MPTTNLDRPQVAVGAAVIAAAGLSSRELIDLVGFDPHLAEIAEGVRKKPRAEWTPDEVLTVRKYDSAMNRARQIANTQEAKSGLSVINELMATGNTPIERTRRLARAVLVAIAKEVGLGFRTEVRDAGSDDIIAKFAETMGGEEGQRQIAEIADLMQKCVRGLPAVASRGVVFEGNVPGTEVVESFLKLRPNAKAKDLQLQQTLRAELGEPSKPEGSDEREAG